VNGLRLFHEHPVILFGDGAAFKSYFALFTGGELARRGLRVMYVDWEMSKHEHRERIERIFGPQFPSVLYVRGERPLVHEVDRLVRLREQHRVDFMIFDSIVFACDGPPEAAEVALRYFQAVRQLRVGSLHLAHTNRSERAEEKPFGSAFWHNGARGTWFAKRMEDSSGDNVILVGLFNKKSNLGRHLPPEGFRIHFDGDRTVIQPTDLATDSEVAERMSLHQRMMHALREGPLTIAALAAQLGANPDSVDRIVRRFKTRFVRLTSAKDGVHRVALVEVNR
jgi:hypothetical protein